MPVRWNAPGVGTVRIDADTRSVAEAMGLIVASTNCGI
jgi:hypothetical protein